MSGPKIQNCGCPNVATVLANTPDANNYFQVARDAQKALACAEQCAYQNIPKEKVAQLFTSERGGAKNYLRFLSEAAKLYSEALRTDPQVQVLQGLVYEYQLLSRGRYETD